jgi:hypothetical protein
MFTVNITVQPYNVAEIGPNAYSSVVYNNGVTTVDYDAAGTQFELTENNGMIYLYEDNLTGNQTVITRVTGFGNGPNLDPPDVDDMEMHSRAGIMIRPDSDALDSAFFGISLRSHEFLGPNRMIDIVRRNANGEDVVIEEFSTTALPVWLKITKVDNVYTAFRSSAASPGDSDWIQVGTPYTDTANNIAPAAGSYTAGKFVNVAGDGLPIRSTRTTFSNFSVNEILPDDGGGGAAYKTRDVGTVYECKPGDWSGKVTENNDVITIESFSQGAFGWGTTPDSYSYVYIDELTGDQRIVAKVDTAYRTRRFGDQVNNGPMNSGGRVGLIMLQEPYLAATPHSVAIFIDHAGAIGTSQRVGNANSNPANSISGVVTVQAQPAHTTYNVWLMLDRQGNTVRAYFSTATAQPEFDNFNSDASLGWREVGTPGFAFAQANYSAGLFVSAMAAGMPSANSAI